MVDGLDAEPTPSWEGGDFATIVHTLKLLGFNAVRLPFQFSGLYLKKPQVCCSCIAAEHVPRCWPVEPWCEL
jgi:hypothetical protein